MQHEEYLQTYLPRNKQGTAINVGAHDGQWVDKFSPLFSSVIAVEANPKYAESLRGRWPNVEVYEAAGWISTGQTMDFHVRNSMPMNSALACRDLMREDAVDEVIRVQTLAIDTIPKNACDLIWVDVEGAELQVLMGATRTIEAYRPMLVIECHEIEHRDWLTTWLERAGYNLAVVHNPTVDSSDPNWARFTHLIGYYYKFNGVW
jgi:FkbM family methyltransferase